eukprot:7176862-Prorocentrum_lima.AAC.1
MTSSLVGSEMCIRDRTIGSPASLKQLSRGRKNSNSSRSAPSGALLNSPVSYTHLTLPTICSV